MLLDSEVLAQIADAVVARFEQSRDLETLFEGKERIGYKEEEAAALLGVAKHVLRDARLRGEVFARRIGKSYVYGQKELVEWLSCTGRTQTER